MTEYAAHVEIEPHVHLIRGFNRSRFPEANSVLIDDEILTLVDAGSSMEHIEKTLQDLGHGLEDIDRIVLTHFHIDHKGHAQHIHNISGCEVICNLFSNEGVESFHGMARYYGIADHPKYEAWKSRIGMWLPHVISDYSITGNYYDRRPICCGEVDIIPLHLPGHTIDHTCFGINGFDTIFLVDIDLTRFGPWYGNEVSNIHEFETSIQAVIDLQPTNGISSHLIDPVSENLVERLENYLSVFGRREKAIINNIANGYNTLEKLVRIPTIYPRIPDEVYYVFEEFMLNKHLELLIREEKVSDNNGVLKVEKG